MHYGVYIKEFTDNYLEAEKYFNQILNKYFYNDNLNIYKGNYTFDKNSSPYYTIYKTPLFIYNLLTFFILTIIIIIIFILYLWISLYSIRSQKETLWTLKANGMSNIKMSIAEIIGDLVPQSICFIIAMPLSIIFYKIFWFAIQEQYAFDLSKDWFNLFSILIMLGFGLLMFLFYLAINLLIIKKEIKIQNQSVKISKLYIYSKNVLYSKQMKLNWSISSPNFNKSFISGILLFLIYFVSGFGILFNSSLYQSSKYFEQYMLPYKNYSGQFLLQEPIPKELESWKEPEEYESIDFSILKNCNITIQECLKYFKKEYEDKDPRELKILSKDLHFFLNASFKNQKLIEVQQYIQNQLLRLNIIYDQNFYPDIYFKNYPKLNYQSTFNIKGWTEIGYIIVGLEEEREIFKEFDIKENEVILTSNTYYELKKWGHIDNNNILSLRLNNIDGELINIEFKVKSVTFDIIDNYYIFADKKYLTKKLTNNKEYRNNMYYTENYYPLVSEILVLPTCFSGETFSDYFDKANRGLFNPNIELVDYKILTDKIISKSHSFGKLTIYCSFVLLLISFLVIIIVMTLTIISNKEIIIILKQMGYKTNQIVFYILSSYFIISAILLLLNFAIIGLITQSILNLMGSLVKIDLLISYNTVSFIVPIIIYLSFIFLLYIVLKTYLKKAKLINNL